MSITFISGLLTFILGVAATIGTFSLEVASIGIPYAPKVFPGVLGILLIICSIVIMIKEIISQRNAETRETVSLKSPYLIKILLTCVFGVIYALLFKVIGYVLATMFFMGAELWLFNGRKNWKINTIVAVAFSLFIYIIFSKLLGVYLPQTPIIWF